MLIGIDQRSETRSIAPFSPASARISRAIEAVDGDAQGDGSRVTRRLPD